jgi:hypothetical protein
MRRAFCLLLLLAFTPVAHSGDNFRVAVTCQKKRLSAEKKQVNHVQKVEEQWGYAITLQNQSFKDVPDVRVDYIIFYRQELAGRVENNTRDKRSAGSQTVGLLKNNVRETFETEPIKLGSSKLDVDYDWTSGAKTRAKDVITGIKVRVKSGEAIIAEYADPAGLKSSEGWN